MGEECKLVALMSLTLHPPLALEIGLLKPSATNKNKRSKPLEALEKLEGDPFNKIAKEAKDTPPKIQFIVFKFIPICKITNLRYIQFTLSYAFLNSIFITIAMILFKLIECNPSY